MVCKWPFVTETMENGTGTQNMKWEEKHKLEERKKYMLTSLSTTQMYCREGEREREHNESLLQSRQENKIISRFLEYMKILKLEAVKLYYSISLFFNVFSYSSALCKPLQKWLMHVIFTFYLLSCWEASLEWSLESSVLCWRGTLAYLLNAILKPPYILTLWQSRHFTGKTAHGNPLKLTRPAYFSARPT